MAPPNPMDLAAQGLRTLQAFGRRVPVGGGVLAPSLQDAVSGRTVLITGASSGIGKSAALKIGEAGGTVLLVARTREKLEEVAGEIEQLGGLAYVHPCNLSDMDDIDRMAAEVLEQHEAVDILINNAGKSIRRSVTRTYDRFHDYQRTMQLNYFGPVKLILDLLPSMRERKTGHIVNISTIGLQVNTPRFAAYVADQNLQLLPHHEPGGGGEDDHRGHPQAAQADGYRDGQPGPAHLRHRPRGSGPGGQPGLPPAARVRRQAQEDRGADGRAAGVHPRHPRRPLVAR
jgi:hypothetical protein